jgi:hypothetical protein
MTREQTLNDIMTFDQVIRVHPDGTIEDSVPGVDAPQLYMDTVDDECGSILPEHEADYIKQAEGQGWEILSGWTGQYGYSGICMHASEFVGGGLEDHIRETPGLYVVLTVDTDDEDGPTEWVIAYRAEEENAKS